MTNSSITASGRQETGTMLTVKTQQRHNNCIETYNDAKKSKTKTIAAQTVKEEMTETRNHVFASLAFVAGSSELSRACLLSKTERGGPCDEVRAEALLTGLYCWLSHCHWLILQLQHSLANREKSCTWFPGSSEGGRTQINICIFF